MGGVASRVLERGKSADEVVKLAVGPHSDVKISGWFNQAELRYPLIIHLRLACDCQVPASRKAG